jgi:surfeit locus 1 family protein
MMTSRVRKLIVPTLMTAIMLPVLIYLGFWQLERKEWKDRILANLSAPVAELPATARLAADMELRRVRFTCLADGLSRQEIPETDGMSTEQRVYLRCPRASGETVIVDAGYKSQFDDAYLLPGHKIEGTVRVWEPLHWADKVAGVQKTTRDTFRGAGNVSLYFMRTGAAPRRENISNNHFLYALQWFAFAGVLTIIYSIFARRIWRESSAPS